MPPRKTRASKKNAQEVVEEQPVQQEAEEVVAEVGEETTEVSSKGKGKADVVAEDVMAEDVTEQPTADQDEAKGAEETAKGRKLTPEERLEKLKELRRRMVR